MVPDGNIEERLDGHLIKVVEVVDQGSAFFGRLPNGNTARFSLGQAASLRRGDIVLVGEDQWTRAPELTWPGSTTIGIVRRILDDGVLIEANARIEILRIRPTIEIKIGNTVEYDDIDGIVRIVSETPLRYRDSGIDDEDVEKFRVGRSEGGVTFSHFGGYHDVRARAKELIETQLERRPALHAIRARPIKGIIFTGPPGTGKTHLARIIAQESDAAFYLVSGPTIVSKWVGDSEEMLRRIFEAAATEERAIIFFDEIDSIAERRRDESHEASKRLVAQFLTLLDGFDQEHSNVVVIAATNRIEDVDPAILRPGRFDWEIVFGLPAGLDRLEILNVDANKHTTRGDLPIDEIADLTEGWSGARLSSIWTEAALVAAGDGRTYIADEDLAEAFERVSARPDRDRGDS